MVAARTRRLAYPAATWRQTSRENSVAQQKRWIHNRRTSKSLAFCIATWACVCCYCMYIILPLTGTSATLYWLQARWRHFRWFLDKSCAALSRSTCFSAYLDKFLLKIFSTSPFKILDAKSIVCTDQIDMPRTTHLNVYVDFRLLYYHEYHRRLE